MFITAVCLLFLLKLKWPKNKSVYDLTRSVYFHCHYFPYLVLVFLFKFNCSLGNRYF